MKNNFINHHKKDIKNMDDSHRITNTTTDGPHFEALLPGGIEAMESRGARQMAAQTGTVVSLPRSGSANPVWARIGVIFDTKPIDGDNLFLRATIPAGWSIKQTDHSMYTKLVDDKGRERAMIFYKAAFYDRRADINPSTRFSIDAPPSAPGEPSIGTVKDGGRPIYRTVPFTHVPYPDPKRGEKWDGWQSASDKARAAAAAWLHERFPECSDPAAYWDLPDQPAMG